MTREIEFEVRIPVGRSNSYLAGFMDMMRYDHPVVVSWDHEYPMQDREVFVVRLRGPRCTEDRWASFGIRPTITG